MKKYSRGLVILVVVTLLFILASTTLYYFGMNILEERSRTFLQSLEFVTQTMTTVGYGQDAPWTTAPMFVLVIVTQLAGISLVFLSIPIVVTPWISERLSIRPPTRYGGPENHILITRYTESIDALLVELEKRHIDYLVIDGREDVAKELYRNGKPVMFGDPHRLDVLKKAKAEHARLAILDGPDERNATIALSLQELETDYEIVAIAQSASLASHLNAAGVDQVIYPRENIGAVLARQAISGLDLQMPGKRQEKKEDTRIKLQEFPVLKSSPLVGKTLKDSEIRNRTGADVVGIWHRGDLIHSPGANYRIRENDILAAAGTGKQLKKLQEIIESPRLKSIKGSPNVVIIGYGSEGISARRELKEAGVHPTVVNKTEDDEVDVVGNEMDPEVLNKANIENADAVLITLMEDEETVMTTLMVKRLNPAAKVLVSVRQSDITESVYLAGANYVQSLTQITSRMLAGSVLGEDLLNVQLNIKIRRCGAGNLSGKTPAGEEIGKTHKVSIIAVKRDGKLMTEIDPDLQFEPDDQLYVAGTDDQVNDFARYYNMGEDPSRS